MKKNCTLCDSPKEYVKEWLKQNEPGIDPEKTNTEMFKWLVRRVRRMGKDGLTPHLDCPKCGGG